MNIKNINLPQPSKYLLSLLLKRRAGLKKMENTDVYVVTFKGKELIFMGDYTPLIPYMYGIVFSNQKYWFEILKDIGFKFAWNPRRSQTKIKILLTEDSFYNALVEKRVKITGDGKSKVEQLIARENIRRANSSDKLLYPVKIFTNTLSMKKILPRGEILELSQTEYVDITDKIDRKKIKKLQKIKSILAGLPFLCFELFVRDLSNIDKFTLGKVFITPGENIFCDLTNGKLKKPCATYFMERMLK